MEAIHVIKKPVVTEKGTWGMNEQNRYVFQVDTRATKTDIRKAIEDLYKVKVAGVNTQTRKGKRRRVKTGWSEAKLTKLASVKLAEGDKIDLF
ncbi:MAG TPA: 50S ribosomal protein L23 [Phycisphaerales bacterium]|jgi:large subunit ribosomal protein L23|nr:50S ribosomal protein L23 [Phycisphaerales bacterium]